MECLRTFLVLAIEQKNVSKTARHLGIPPQRVRYRIAMVEKVVGTKLLERRPPPVNEERGRTQLTEAGRELLLKAIDALQAHDRMFAGRQADLDWREINRVVATELVEMSLAALRHNMSEEQRDHIYRTLLSDRPDGA